MRIEALVSTKKDSRAILSATCEAVVVSGVRKTELLPLTLRTGSSR